MPRTCTICSHEHRDAMEELLATRQRTYRGIARKYGVSEDAVSRHVKSGHVSQLLALAAIAQARRNIELIGEVTRELDRAGTVNLELTVEWQEVRAVLVNTLASYPEAQQAVFDALEEAPDGD